MAIDVVLAGTDDLIQEHMGEHFRDRPIRPARRRAIEIEAVDRREKSRAPLEHRRIDDRNRDDRPGELRGIEALNRPHDRVDARILGGVDPCCQAKTRAGTVAVHDDQREADRLGGSLADGQESAGARSRFGHDVPNADRFRFHSRSSRA